MQDKERRRPVPRGSITGALILIVLGFLWLLNNLGYLPGDIWYNLWRFWPVILILLGVDIALRGFPAWFALPVLLVVVVMLVGAVLLVAPTLPGEEIVTESLSQDLAALSQAQVQLEMNGGTLHVQRLDDQRQQLMRGQFTHSSNIVIQQEFSEASGRGNLTLADRYEAFFPFFFLAGTSNDWTVEFTPLIPLELNLDIDAGPFEALGLSYCQLDLNLNDLALEILTAELEDCGGKLALPSTDRLNASLSLDESQLTVSMPADVGARVELNLDDTELTIDSSRFTKISDNEYLSREYDEAETRLDLTLRATDSFINIQ